MLVTDDDRTLIVDRATLLGPGPAPEPEPAQQREPALRGIIAYKFARAGLAFVLAIVLGVCISTGRTELLQQYAAQILHHFSSHFSSALADAIMRGIASPRVWLVVAALVVDGLISGIEGWALLRNRPWGAWLVVIATGALVPFEVAGLLRHPHVGRALLLLVNAAVALYLLRRALRHRA
jgi:uncharacterized membrane protein (DUF2068 family)